jgi:hypothetical protein
MRKINAEWHRAHPMPKNPTGDQRLDWHLEHVKKCGCRGIPAGVLKLMEARGIAEPKANFDGGVRRK